MLTAVVLTRNEEKNIEKCLSALKFCDQIVVVDDQSSDNTVKLAKKLGALVLSHQMEDYGRQHNWAIEQIKSTWFLFVDADEVVSPELRGSIQDAVKKNEVNGYLVRRVDHLWGHKLKYGDVGNLWLLRLAKRGAGVWQGEVHEIWEIEGRTARLSGDLDHYPHQSVVSFLRHLNNYSTVRANEFYKLNRKTNIVEIVFGPVWRFIYLYIYKLGFLDGTAGFVHAMLMAFYMFLVAGKLYLLYKGIPKGEV